MRCQPEVVSGVSLGVEVVAARARGVDAGDVRLSADRDAAVTALFHAQWGSLVRLARLLVDDRETAEDVVQDAFGQLHRHWNSLRDTNAALYYLRAAVANGARNRLRSRGRAVLRTPLHVVATPAAEVTALENEEHHEVLRGLRALPWRQRQVLVLRYYLDLSETEIAATLEISKGAVKSHTSRGMSALSRRLERAP